VLASLPTLADIVGIGGFAIGIMIHGF